MMRPTVAVDGKLERPTELDHVGVFNFSREEGTVAALLPKRVPQREIDSRRRELLRIQRQVSKKKLRALHGRFARDCA